MKKYLLFFIVKAFIYCPVCIAQEEQSTTGSTAVPQTFAESPEDVTVKEGGHAIFPCVVKNRVGKVRWTKDDFGLGEERNLTGFNRYEIIGSNETDNYTLKIHPVLLEDEAKLGFQCQIGAGEGGSPPAERSKKAKLTVTVSPEPPVILNGDVLRTVEGPDVEIKCSSRGGKPSATIKWFDGDEKEISAGVTTDTEPYENTQRETLVSTLKFTPGKSDHNTTRICKATHDSITMNVSIHLLVEYSPDITITMTSHSTPTLEGENVIFNCTATSNPPEMSYRWFIDGEIVPEVHGTEYIIPNVDRSLNKKSITCEVRNVIGSEEKSEPLEINFGPRFLKTPEDYSGEKEQTAKLTCLVDGNPEPKYIWFRNGNQQIVHSYEDSNSELSFKISEDTIGKYICRALVEGFPEVEASAEVLMKGAPHFYEQSEIQFGQEGTDIEIICNAFSIPPPDKISWNISSTMLVVDASSNRNGKYIVKDKKRKDGIISTLTINNAMYPSDFVDYTCTVENALGKDAVTINLKRERSLPILIILSAVIGGILLTIVTILIMLLGRRSTAQSLRIVNGDQQQDDEEEESMSIGTTENSSTSSTWSSSKRSDKVVTNRDKSYGLDLDDPLLLSSLPQKSILPSVDVYDELLHYKEHDLDYFEANLDHDYAELPNKKGRGNKNVYQSPHYKRNYPVPPPRKYKSSPGNISKPRRVHRSKQASRKRPSRTSRSSADTYQYSANIDDSGSLNNNIIYSDPSVSHI